MLFGHNSDDTPLLYREHNDDDEILEINEYPIFCFNCVYTLPKFINAKSILKISNFLLLILWIVVLIIYKYH